MLLKESREDSPGPERYRRLYELGWNMDLLHHSTVLVVGAGALGNEIIKNLALAGLGNILVVDSDTIESHNLTRSVLFRPTDMGQGKAEVAARTAKEIDPGLTVRWFDAPVQQTLGLGVFRRVDVVLSGVDNLQTRRDLNRSCMLTSTPFIDGGMFYLDGDVRTFLPPFEVCFDCTLTQEERAEGWRRWSCLKLVESGDSAGGPTAPTVASMVGGLQAQLALKFVHRNVDGLYDMPVPAGVRIRFNGFADEYERWNLNRNPECPTHMDVAFIPEPAIQQIPYGNDISAGHLLDIAQDHLGPEAYVELGFDVIHMLSCGVCSGSQAVLRRPGTLEVGEAVCPRCTPPNCRSCGSLISETIRSRSDLVFADRLDCATCTESNPLVIRDTETINRIEPLSPALNYTLSQLGVPLLDILEAKSVDAPESIFLELGRDRNRVFGDT